MAVRKFVGEQRERAFGERQNSTLLGINPGGEVRPKMVGPSKKFLPEAKPTGLVEAMSGGGGGVCDNLVRGAFGVTIPDHMRLTMTHMTCYDPYDSI